MVKTQLVVSAIRQQCLASVQTQVTTQTCSRLKRLSLKWHKACTNYNHTIIAA